MNILRLKNAAYLLVIILIAALYLPFLENPFIFDDTPFFEGEYARYSRDFPVLELRTLSLTTLSWNAQYFDFNMVYLRLGNLLLHLCVICALFLFTQQLLQMVLGGGCQWLDKDLRWLLLFSILFFGLHPVNTYGVGYLMQRTIVMATLFSLLAMLAFLYGCKQKNAYYFGLSVFFYALAVFCKEHVVMLPLVLIVLTILLYQNWKRMLKQYWLIFLAYGLIIFLVLWIRKHMIASAYEPQSAHFLADGDQPVYMLSVLTQMWLFFKYWLIWLFPCPDWLSVDIRVHQASGVKSIYILAALAYLAYGGIAFLMLTRRGREGVIGFALLFPWIMFFTELATVRLQEPFVLYRSYLWIVGLCILLPVLLMNVRLRILLLILPGVLVMFFAVSTDRLATFAHPVLLWEDAKKIVESEPGLPGSYRIYNNLGMAYLGISNLEKGIAALEQARTLSPLTNYIYSNLGIAYAKSGMLDAASEHFNAAIEMRAAQKLPIDVRLYLDRAKLYELQGKYQQAKEDWLFACGLTGIGCEKLALPRLVNGINW